ncbi:MAG: peptide deformylase [Deferribacteraceae bacterium]|jgi:peptide deformylase|nr:peptide deformylase [Deferribacteraceae bacterium]
MVLEILTFPSEVLRRKAAMIDSPTDKLNALIENMKETLYAANGFGLAAPQVGESIRLIVYDETAGREGQNPKIIINPEIVEESGEQIVEEGCLSIPGEYVPVKRYLRVLVKALDENFDPVIINAEGHTARIMQHEIDHLNGVLFIDRLPSFRRDTIKKHIKRRIANGEYKTAQ